MWQVTMFTIGASERKPTHCIALAALGILAGSWWCWVLGVHVQDVGESGAPDRWVKLEVPGRDIATDVQGRILGSGQKIVCLIDAPTSKPKQVLELMQQARKQSGPRKGLVCWWQRGNAPTFWVLCFKTYSSTSPRQKFFMWCSPKALRKGLGACFHSVSTAGEVNAKEMLFRAP